MKDLSLKMIIVVSASVLMAFTTISNMMGSNVSVLQVLTYPIIMHEIEIEAPVMVIDEASFASSHELFLDALGFRESSNDYQAVNRFGYLGKYQFGRTTLNKLGYDNISNREFLSDPDVQEQAMQDLLKHNADILEELILKYDGSIVHGIEVTQSGILAAAHLAGPRNVKKWFRSGKDFQDGLGTKMSSYLKKFSGYELDLP